MTIKLDHGRDKKRELPFEQDCGAITAMKVLVIGLSFGIAFIIGVLLCR